MRIIDLRYTHAISELIARRLGELNLAPGHISKEVGLTNQFTLGKIIACRAALQPQYVESIASRLGIDRRYLLILSLLQFHDLSDQTVRELLAEPPTAAMSEWVKLINKRLKGVDRAPSTRERAVLKKHLNKKSERRENAKSLATPLPCPGVEGAQA